MMKNKLPAFFAFFSCIFLLSAQDGLLLRNTFDTFSVHAEKSENPKCLRWQNPSLELRAFPGVRGKGNAVALADNEFLLYAGEKNLNPAEGTVSFWFAPQSDVPTDYRHVYCAVMMNGGIFTVQQANGYKEQLLLTLFVPGRNGAPARTFTARQDLPPGLLKKGVWHKIDVVWNKERMALYLDGALRRIKPTEHWLKTSPSVSALPPDLSFSLDGGSRISFNMQITNKKTEPGRLTAYDEIAVYGRALNADEIRREYMRYFSTQFVSSARVPFFEMPEAMRKITLDGKLGAEEWSDAASLPVIRSAKPLEIRNPFGARAMVKYDKEKLYAGFSVAAPPVKAKTTQRDGAVYADDCFELHLFNPATKKQYQFVINSNGALFDSCPTDRVSSAWNSSAKGAARVGNGQWSAELEIPLSEIGNPAPGTEWKINLCSVNFSEGKPVYNMLSSSDLGFFHEPAMARFLWGGRNGGFSLENVRVSNDGGLSAGFTASARVKVSASIQSESERTADCPFELNGKTWNITRNPGVHIFTLKAVKPGGRELLEYDFLYQVRKAFEFEYAFYPSRKGADIRLCVNNPGGELAGILKTKGVPVEVALLSPQGKRICSKTVTMKEYSAHAWMDIPVKTLVQGTYSFQATFRSPAFTYSASLPFRVPDMTPLKVPPVMVNHEVPPPWVPLKKTAARTYEVLDRVYEFGDGPWPRQIVSRGEKLFTEPPEIMMLPGKPFVWKKFEEGKLFPDYVELSGSGENGSVRLSWKGELWFDGMYKLQWTLSPLKASADIRNLFLCWKSPSGVGRYVTSPVFRPWNGDSMKLRYDPNNASEVLLWHSGYENGLSWWCQSDANWVNENEEKQILLTRGPKDLEVRINIISKPAVLREKASYVMTLIATPARRRPAKFRTFNYECLTDGTYGMTSGWGSYTATRMWADDTIAWTSNIPRDPEGYEKVIDGWRAKHNVKLFCYAMPTHLAELEPEYDYFYPECATIPGFFWQGTSKEDGRPYYTKPCCQDTAVCDIMLWRLERMFKRLPKLGGIYHDICVERPCSNPFHGCGGTDAFGKKYVSTNALRLRTYLMRVYKLTRKMSMEMMNHGHDKFNPIAHNFGDCWYPGEEITFTEVAANPLYFYCESRSPEEYQFRFNSNIHGMGINLLVRTANPEVAAMVPHLDFFKGEGYFRQYITPAVLFDFNAKATMTNLKSQGKFWKLRSKIRIDEAEFFGYWTHPGVTSESGAVKVSCYFWKKPSPYSVVLAIGNLSRNEAKLALKIDYAKMRLNSSAVRFFDLWDGEREISLGELNRSTVKGPGFRLIGIRD